MDEGQTRMNLEGEDAQFALIHGTDHDTSTFRIGGEVLTGDDTPRTAFTESFLMQFNQSIGHGIVLQDDNPTGIRSDDDIVYPGSV